MPRFAAASIAWVTMLATRRRGLSADCGSWNTIWTWSRRKALSSRPVAVTSRPASVIRPSVGCSRPTIRRASVLLPLPLSPTMPTNSFSLQREADVLDRAELRRLAEQAPAGDEGFRDASRPPERSRTVDRRHAARPPAAAIVGGRLPGECRPRCGPGPTSSAAAARRSRHSGSRCGTARREAAAGQLLDAPAGPACARARANRPRRVAAHARVRELQAARIGMRRVREQLPRRPAFGRPAGIEHEDLVADLRGEPQVVGDEDHRGAVALLHLGDQLHDARLDRHVERGGRLVGDHAGAACWRRPSRSARAGTCRRRADADTCSSSSAPCGRCTDSNASSACSRHSRGLRRPMRARCSSQLLADGQHRIERGERLLRDERDVAAEQAAALLRRPSSRGRRRRTRALPPVTEKPDGRSCAMVRPIIDLPAPDSPTRPRTFPAPASKFRSRDDRQDRRCASSAPTDEIAGCEKAHGHARSVSAQARIERAAQAVAEHVEAEHREEDRKDRADQVPRRLVDVLARIGDHLAPGRRLRRRRSCRRRTGSPRRSPRCPSRG